jgi:DNA-binding beta-propeller fold protein YncE
LNLAARLCAAAVAGEILASETVVSLAGRVDGVKAVERRPIRVKGRDAPVRSFRIEPTEPLPPVPVPPARPEGRQPRISSARAAAIAIGVVVLLAVLVGAVIVRSGDGGKAAASAPRIPAASVVLLDRHTGKVVRAIPAELGDSHVSLVVAGGRGWTYDSTPNLVAVDPAGTARRISTLRGAPVDIATDGKTVWVAEGYEGRIEAFSARNGAPEQALRLPLPPRSFAGGPSVQPIAMSFGDGSLWTVGGFTGDVLRLDPRSGRYSRIAVNTVGFDVAASADDVWVGDTVHLLRFSARSGSHIEPDVRTGNPENVVSRLEDLGDIAVGDNAAWYADGRQDQLLRIDAGTQGVQTFKVGLSPVAVAVDPDPGGAVWVANSQSGTVSRFDPTTENVRTIRLGHAPTAIAIGGRYVWVVVQPA